MNREVHVRFWEGLAVRFRWATQLISHKSSRKYSQSLAPVYSPERSVRGWVVERSASQ